MNDFGQILLYKNSAGDNQIEVKMYEDTVWLMQEQIVELYQSSKSNISEHIKHILEEGELNHKKHAKRISHGSCAVAICEQAPTWLVAYTQMKIQLFGNSEQLLQSDL